MYCRKKYMRKKYISGLYKPAEIRRDDLIRRNESRPLSEQAGPSGVTQLAGS